MKRAYEVLVGILASRSGIANGIDSNRTGFRDINGRRRAVVDLVAEEVMRAVSVWVPAPVGVQENARLILAPAPSVRFMGELMLAPRSSPRAFPSYSGA